MNRVAVVVEGQTEEAFITNVLAPWLWPHQTYLTPIILGVPGHKGGNVKYARVKKDILLRLKQDPKAYCSTMLDLYGLGPGFPGTPAPPDLSGIQKAEWIERAVSQNIIEAIPDLRPEIRFIPYLQVHEYEGLLFSDPSQLAESLGRPALYTNLLKIRNAFATPEHINEDPGTAPSKRICGLHPAYQKVTDGIQAARSIGLAKMRQECLHFHGWVSAMESLTDIG